MKQSTRKPAPIAATILAPALALSVAGAPTQAQADGPWLDEPQTDGTWIYTRSGGESHAIYGSVADPQKFAITCVRASGQLRLSRPGEPIENASMRIRTETQSRELAVAPLVGARGISIVFAGLPANDSLLDAMAITKGRFAVETDGMPSLFLPAWAEVTRVIEDCR